MIRNHLSAAAVIYVCRGLANISLANISLAHIRFRYEFRWMIW